MSLLRSFPKAMWSLDGEELNLTQSYLWKSGSPRTEDFPSIFLYSTSPFKSGEESEGPLGLATPDRAGSSCSQGGLYAPLIWCAPSCSSRSLCSSLLNAQLLQCAAHEAVHENHSEVSVGPEHSLGNDGFALVYPWEMCPLQGLQVHFWMSFYDLLSAALLIGDT